MYRKTNGVETDGQTERQTDTQTDRQTIVEELRS